MSTPYHVDSDPDPTSQIAWPAARHRQRTTSDRQLEQDSEPGSETAVSYQSTEGTGKRSMVVSEHVGYRLTTWNLITLSISMAGAQIAWTVELGYGTPFLLSLGISEQVTSLVWLAGPISGLVAQPLIGAISDSSHSKYRRRYWVALSTVALVFSTTALAYCQSVAAFFVDLFGGGAGDWDPVRQKQVSNVAIGIAVFAFYILDFALNALQASLRNLLLDITPPEQLNAGNAWHSRMSQAGNIVGYGFGFLPLAKLPFLSFLGGDQFRKFCILSMTILVITVWITCFCHEEKETVDRRKDKHNKLNDVLENIYAAITTLPEPIRRVCFVQLFAFMGWFPFLFYSTTYVGQIMAYQLGREPDLEIATRTGEFAMLLYSIVAVIAGVVLPELARRDPRLLPEEGDDERTHAQRLRLVLHRWREESVATGKPLRLPRKSLFLRDIWTGAMLLFTALMISSFWISTVGEAITMISLVGICWSVACWVPFAIIMEFLKEMRDSSAATPCHLPDEHLDDEHGLLLEHQYAEADVEAVANESTVGGSSSDAQTKPVAGGTILGIHNLAIVMPQFIIALVASAIFRFVDESAPIPDDASLTPDGLGDHTTYYGKNGVAWVLRFGALCTLLGAAFARMVPPTRAEKDMRAALRTLKSLKEAEEP
ncbi:hypothetical protein PAXRUDRAFT_8078 [Paxillus rubicundulus Ve08.2h10]|uniref:MFS general substrate transporter n=1 Tax=Paxillus rubicundulus Ve08.2h10 TaxID=930991 RepID=A0A0D0DY33_9AGAM|nr:hypothetical protein PAXRUDRAFT_8078 [Paxillus rubicundulus Ve08.2h10]